MNFSFSFSVTCDDHKMCNHSGLCERQGDYSFCTCMEGTSGDFCENFDQCKYLCGNKENVTCKLGLNWGASPCGCKDDAYKFDYKTKSCKRMFHY